MISKVDYCISVLAGVTTTAEQVAVNSERLRSTTRVPGEDHGACQSLAAGAAQVADSSVHSVLILTVRSRLPLPPWNGTSIRRQKPTSFAADGEGRRHFRSADARTLVVLPTRRSTLDDRAFRMGVSSETVCCHPSGLSAYCLPSVGNLKRTCSSLTFG